MKNDSAKWCTEVNSLLNEICQFLDEDSGNLAPKAKGTAKTLVAKSKTQMEKISNLVSKSDFETGKYVDMKSKHHVSVDTDEYVDADHNDDQIDEAYLNLADHSVDKIANEIQKPKECPYLNLPASKIPDGGKCGNIMRKEKIFLFEIQRNFFAAIHDSWLLIYYTKKQLKPFESYDLRECEAAMSETHRLSFEFTSKSKSFTVVCSSRKDVIQWVAAINFKLQPFPPLSSQRFPLKEIDDVEDQQIYEELEEVSDKVAKVIMKPSLPPRQVECAINISDKAECRDDALNGDAEKDTYDLVRPKASQESSDEQIYELIREESKENDADANKIGIADYQNAFAPDFDTKKLSKKKTKYKLNN